MTQTIYVGNIQWDTTEKELEDLFKLYGKTRAVKIIKDHNTGKSKGFAFVEMENNAGEATEAMDKLNGFEFRGRTLKINNARQSKRYY